MSGPGGSGGDGGNGGKNDTRKRKIYQIDDEIVLTENDEHLRN